MTEGLFGKTCPIATQDVHVNLKNRNHAFKEYGYGPPNPDEPNEYFWLKKAKMYNAPTDAVKSLRCGNCAAFDQEPKMLQCIAKGMGDGGDPWSAIEAGDLGYCEIFDFKCASSRTCRAWVAKDEGEEYDEEYDDSDEYAGGKNAAMEGEDES